MPHVVKRGDTLSKIARANGITLAQLLDANPEFRTHPNRINVGDIVILPGEAPAPPPSPPLSPSSTPSPFATRLASIAQEQHARFEFVDESDPLLCSQIRRWTEDIGFTFVSCTSNDHPWSAVFVSWCVKEAGATAAEFEFALAHSVFVHRAIQNADNGTGVFRGFKITDYAPKVGDIIHHNRPNKRLTFAFAKAHDHYQSHSVIVIEVGQDAQGNFAFCIGGNEHDAIRRSVVRLDARGFIIQRDARPFISVIQNLK